MHTKFKQLNYLGVFLAMLFNPGIGWLQSNASIFSEASLMRIPYVAIIAMIVAVFFALAPAHAVKSTAKWGNISTAELSAKLESGEDVCLINVLPQINCLRPAAIRFFITDKYIKVIAYAFEAEQQINIRKDRLKARGL